MTKNIEDRLDEQAVRVRRTYQDHIAAAETISRLEADEQEAEHVIAEIERLTAENQELRDLAVLPDGYVVTYATEFANGTIQLTCKPEATDG